MRRSGNIFLLAILIAALSAAMIYRYLRDQQLALEQARNAALGSTVEVTVASEIIGIGDRIEAQQVRTVRWPLDAEPEGAIHDVQRVVGRIARTTLEKNQPVVESNLISEGAGLLPLLITEGMRAMSVKVDKVTGVSGFITPSSRVDVLVSGTVQGAGEESQQQSKLFLQNIKVLAIGTTIEQRDNEAIEVPTVTLLITPEDAEKLTLATRQEPVHLALRNYRDEENVTTQGVTTAELFGRDGRATARQPRRAGPPPRPSVEVLLGEERTQQRF
jgi:pilus assembly protein CpaB